MYFREVSYIPKKIGVLGGGQLGRMMCPPANYLNAHLSFLDPNPNAPCSEVTNQFVQGDFNNFDDVIEFGQDKDIITIEIEHVNVPALKRLKSSGIEVYPQPEVIEIIQNKQRQKQFYIDHNLPTAPFQEFNSKDELKQQKEFFPAFQKLATGGYDGGGVQYLKDENDLEKAFDAPSILEKAISCKTELSVITARNKNGQIKSFPPVEMVFHPTHNLVDYIVAPTYTVSTDVVQKVMNIARKVTEAFQIVGLLAIELFVTPEDEIFINECAPRPHNSGHLTIQGATVSQFEQHLRAISSLPLANPKWIKPSAMVNLLGTEDQIGEAKLFGMDTLMSMEETYLILYGKRETRPHRKMGHVTCLGKNIEELQSKINKIKQNVSIGT